MFVGVIEHDALPARFTKGAAGMPDRIVEEDGAARRRTDLHGTREEAALQIGWIGFFHSFVAAGHQGQVTLIGLGHIAQVVADLEL